MTLPPCAALSIHVLSVTTNGTAATARTIAHQAGIIQGLTKGVIDAEAANATSVLKQQVADNIARPLRWLAINPPKYHPIQHPKPATVEKLATMTLSVNAVGNVKAILLQLAGTTSCATDRTTVTVARLEKTAHKMGAVWCKVGRGRLICAIRFRSARSSPR